MGVQDMRRSFSVVLIGLIGLGVLVGLAVLLWLRWRGAAGEPLIGTKTEAQWLAELRSSDTEAGARAALALADLGDAGLPVLLAARKDADLRVHRQAVRGLILLGARAAPALVEALPSSGERAATALVRIGPEAIPALLQALRDPEKAHLAARVLGGMGPRARSAGPALMAVLQDRQSKAEVRAEAAGALGLIGPETVEGGQPVFDPLVAALASALEDGSTLVRLRAALALEEIGPAARLAVPSLVRVARTGDNAVARAACRALGRMDDPAAVSALAARLRNGEGESREQAAEALVRLGPLAGPAVPLLIPALLDADQAAAAGSVLRRLGPSAVPGLTRALADSDPGLRRAAALQLARLGNWAQPAVGDLQKALSAPRPLAPLAGITVGVNGVPGAFWVTLAAWAAQDATEGSARRACAVALASIDPKSAAPALPVLVEALWGDREAALALGGLGAEGAAVVPALLTLLEDDDPLRSALAARALYRMKPPDSAIPVLRRLLRKVSQKSPAPSPSLRLGIACAMILARIGPGAAEVVPELRALQAIPELRAYAALALVRIDREQAGEAVQGLINDLDGGNPATRAAAVAALIDMGPAGREALPSLRGVLRDPELVLDGLEVVEGVGPGGALLVPDLVGLLSDRDRRVVERAGEVLVQLGAPAGPGLTGALSSPNPQVRAGAARALGQIGPPARSAVAALKTALDDPEANVRLLAAEALGGIGPEASPAVEMLRGWLGSFETDARRQAVLALGRMGPAARVALPDLVNCLVDPDEVVRYGAVRSLGRVAMPGDSLVADLLSTLNDHSPAVRLAGAEALGKVEPERKSQASDVLLGLARRPPLALRREAVAALGEIAPERRKELLPLLLADLRLGSVEGVRNGVLVGLLSPEHMDECRLRLLAVVNGPEERAAIAAAGVIPDLGAGARVLVAELERWPARRSSLAVRQAVTGAVRRLDPKRVPEGQPLHPPDPWDW
jgi:HEAT repeat protein